MEILGIDIGGSGIKGAPVDPDTGECLAPRYRIATPQPATPKAVAGVVARIARHFHWEGLIGCGFPAAVPGGIVQTASNIAPGWIGIDAAALFSRTTGCKTRVVNDADAAGLAEMRFGAGRNQIGVVILITIGTGLGTAVFTDGRLVPNTEFGHLILKGRIAERYASDAVRKRKNLSWKQWGKRLNRYLLRIEELLWPDLMILGGGASKKSKKFFSYLTVQVPVVPAQLLNHAGMIGAALAAQDHTL